MVLANKHCLIRRGAGTIRDFSWEDSLLHFLGVRSNAVDGLAKPGRPTGEWLIGCHCEFTPAGSGRPALDETIRYRHGRACPGRP